MLTGETTFQRLLTGETDVFSGCSLGRQTLTVLDAPVNAGDARQSLSECWMLQTVTWEFIVVHLLTGETSAGGFSDRERRLEWSVDLNRSAANVKYNLS